MITHLFTIPRKTTQLLIILAVVVLAASCNSLLSSGTAKNQYHQLKPGVIGKQVHEFAGPNDFQIWKTPVLHSKISLGWEIHDLGKKEYKTYLRTFPDNPLIIEHSDSVPGKHLTITLQDIPSYINMINSDENLLHYLQQQSQSEVVNSISILLSDSEVQKITSSESLFLVYDRDLRSYFLQIAQPGGQTQLISFSDGFILDYTTYQFCWGVTPKHQLEIRNLNHSGNCQNGLEKNPHKLSIDNTYLKL